MRIGFIGTGNYAKVHAQSVVAVGAKVAACYSATAERRDAFAAEFGATPFSDPLAMISTKTIDVLFIVVPQYVLNGVWERAAIAAGIPFLCEKPVGLNLAVTRQVAREVQQRGLVTSSGYQMRQGTSIAKARDLISANRIAIVRACRMQKPPLVGWFRKQALTGGPMVNAGTHSVDLLRFVFGEVASVSAVVSAGINQKYLPDGDVWDAMASTLRFRSGVVGSMDMGTVSDASTVRHELLDVYGHNFRLIWDSLKDGATIRYKEGSADWAELPMDNDDELQIAHVRNFLDAARTGDPAAVRGSYPDAVETLAVTLAMNRSADEGGKPVELAKDAQHGI